MDAALGLVFLAAYIVGIVSLAAGITYAVVRIFPTERNPKKPEKAEKADSANGTGGGSLFRRSKRGAA